MKVARVTVSFTILLTALAAGQAPSNQEHTITVTIPNAAGIQNFHEVATLVRSIAEIRQMTTDNSKQTVTITAPADQFAMAQWLFREVDIVPGSQALPASGHEYKVGPDDIVRVYSIGAPSSVQDFQEVATMVRSLADIRSVFTYIAPRVLALRSTAKQLALADWMIQQVNQPLNVKRPDISEEYRLTGVPEDVVRIFYVRHADSVQSFQELATVIRSTTQIARAYTYNASRALALRGTADQLALAEWLYRALDQPVPVSRANAPKQPFQVAGNSNDLVRVFFLSPAYNVQRFQQEAVRIRTAANLRRAFTCNAPRALTVRGTADQVATAEQLVDNH